jgi:hypothetical protein
MTDESRRFRQDNTEGYSDSELAILNSMYDAALANAELFEESARKSVEDYIA